MAQAKTALAALWTKRDKALASDDVDTLAPVDLGPARDRDIGFTREFRGQGQSSARVDRPFGPSYVVLPVEARYPLSFLAFVETTGDYSPLTAAERLVGYQTVMLVLTKASNAAPWRVALETEYGGNFGFTAGGNNSYAPAAPSAGITPSQALDDLARYDQESVEQGRTPSDSIFVAGSWTTGSASALASEGPDGLTNGGSIHRVHTYTVSPASDGVYHFAGPKGFNLVCGVIRVTGGIRPNPSRGYLLQNATRDNWGGWLEPGLYAVIRTFELHQVCLGIANTQPGGVTVLSGEPIGVAEWDATGTMATP